VKEHVDTLLRQADAFARGDYDKAYELERTAFRHMFATGRASAGCGGRRSGELPAHFDDAPASSAFAARPAPGEHMELAVDATRAVVSGGDDATAAAAA
jgi:hypothetical protein